MSRPPKDGIAPLSAAERSRLSRARKRAAGLPDLDVVRRALVETVATYPEAARVKLVEALCRRTPADQRDGVRQVAKQLLDLAPPAADPAQLDLEDHLKG